MKTLSKKGILCFFPFITIQLFLSLQFNAQDSIIVFKDYNSFTKKIGESYDKMLGYTNGVKNMKLVLQKNNAEHKVKCEEIWGFFYNGHLFRTDIRTGQVAELILKGKICFYENGPAHLEMIRDRKSRGEFSIGYYCYVSKNLETPLAPFPSPYVTFSDANKQIKRFRKANPEFEELFKNMKGDYEYTAVRSQIIAWEKK